MKIEIKDIRKSFGEKEVLKGVDFSCESGKALGLLGRNGAGKTTTIRIIMGVFDSDEGRILVDGEKINRDKISFGYLPEERGLYPKKQIEEQLIYFARLKGLKKDKAKKEIDYWLERLEITEYRKKKLETLSKGNQQKVQLAVSVICNPDIIILDEPFSGLDPVNATLLKDVVKELVREGKIVIFSSHQMNYVEEFCEDIAIIRGGELALYGNIKAIKRSYDRRKLVIEADEVGGIKTFLEGGLISDGKLIFTMDRPEDKNKVIEKLAKENFDVNLIKVYEPSLNDIFIEYTEDKNETI